MRLCTKSTGKPLVVMASLPLAVWITSAHRILHAAAENGNEHAANLSLTCGVWFPMESQGWQEDCRFAPAWKNLDEGLDLLFGFKHSSINSLRA
jgi:hypothetical protein